MGNTNSSQNNDIGSIVQTTRSIQPQGPDAIMGNVNSNKSVAQGPAIGQMIGGITQPTKQADQNSIQQVVKEVKALQLQAQDDFSVIFYSQPGFQGNQKVVKAGETNVLVGVIGSFTMGKNVNTSFNSSPCLKDKDGNPLEWRYGFANSPQYIPVKDKIKYSIDLTKVTEAPMYAHVTLHLPNPKCACSYAPEVSSFGNVDGSSNSYYLLLFAIILLIAFINRQRLMKMIKG